MKRLEYYRIFKMRNYVFVRDNNYIMFEHNSASGKCVGKNNICTNVQVY